MIYSLDCCIKTNNNGIRNAVKNLIPDIDDPRVWDGQYSYTDTLDVDSVMVFSCEVRFTTESDRNSISAEVKGLAGVINACEDGSFVREHKCYHDETPTKPCEEETILRKG